MCLWRELLLANAVRQMEHLCGSSKRKPRLLACLNKISRGRGLVKISAVWSSEATHSILIRPSETFSVTKRCLISIWRVLLLVEVPLARALALILSSLNTTGTGRSNFASAKMFLIQQMSLVVSVAARYSASVVERLIPLCFLDFHIMADPPYRTV